MELYHNVYGIKNLKSILKCGFIRSNKKYYIKPHICLTRDYNYLSNRGICIVLDYQKLRYNYKVRPYCIRGYIIVHKINRRIPIGDEMEERCYNDISILKCCKRIDVDKNIYNEIGFEHPLFNHTSEFNKKIK